MDSICIISPSFPNMNCGLADYAANLANFLGMQGAQVSVITSDSPKIRAYAGSVGNASVKIYPVIRRWDLFALFTLRKTVSKIMPGSVNIMYHWNVYKDGIIRGLIMVFMPVFLKAGAGGRRVVISFVHDLMGPYLFPKAGPLRKPALLFMLACADAFIVHTKEQEVRLTGLCRIFKKKVYRIPSGSGIFYEGQAGSVNAKEDPKDKKTVLSFFGYLYPSKGLEYLVRAMAILVQKGCHLKLIIIGGQNLDYGSDSFSGYQVQIRKLISEFKMEADVEWTGFCAAQEASSNLLRSDICVLPFEAGVSAKGSSFGTVLSHGLPLVTTKGEDIPDKLVDRQNVLLVPPCDAQAIAAAIEELINNKELRLRLASNAKRVYAEEYSWPVIAARVMHSCLQGAS